MIRDVFLGLALAAGTALAAPLAAQTQGPAPAAAQEQTALEAGLKEYAQRQKDLAALMAKLAKNRSAQIAAAEAAEQEAAENGLDPEQVDGGSNWAALSQGADHKMCGALIAELRSGSTRSAP